MHEISIALRDLSRAPSHRITHIGGKLSNGIPWKITAQEAIDGIRGNPTSYFIRLDDGKKAYLVLGTHPLDGTFLTVDGDTREPKKLLNLPEVYEH